ncbi:IS3 family transposase [Clostridium beijerinckii]|uniref:HTH-like domain-containing protein n=1 Tax=Clostridium beijerinckii TaxID=1520 RepID=A0AAX0AUX3_CLOBE|nr:IS3 family transposase [Clostridium beijerinckii]NRT86746.1 hypothetical protein [Clostridium beijerinckii]NYC72179.1 hypothetical protein [Clostridium beijerinckii]
MLVEEIIKIYEDVDGIYGYCRMTMNLNRRLDQNFNHKRILSTYETCRSTICNLKKIMIPWKHFEEYLSVKNITCTNIMHPRNFPNQLITI